MEEVTEKVCGWLGIAYDGNAMRYFYVCNINVLTVSIFFSCYSEVLQYRPYLLYRYSKP
jgi:hypothetical protein